MLLAPIEDLAASSRPELEMNEGPRQFAVTDELTSWSDSCMTTQTAVLYKKPQSMFSCNGLLSVLNLSNLFEFG
jgi:hypothetical protein